VLERVGKEPAQHAHQLIGMSEGEVKIVQCPLNSSVIHHYWLLLANCHALHKRQIIITIVSASTYTKTKRYGLETQHKTT
jgi:hypothetical protein